MSSNIIEVLKILAIIPIMAVGVVIIFPLAWLLVHVFSSKAPCKHTNTIIRPTLLGWVIIIGVVLLLMLYAPTILVILLLLLLLNVT